jgi:hypothetical protein
MDLLRREYYRREVVDKLMKKGNPVGRVILGLCCFGGIGFQPMRILEGDEKLETYST